MGNLTMNAKINAMNSLRTLPSRIKNATITTRTQRRAYLSLADNRGSHEGSGLCDGHDGEEECNKLVHGYYFYR